MRSTSILFVLAFAASTYAVTVPNTVPNFSADQISEATQSRRDAGASTAKIPIRNLFGRAECVAAYCSENSDCMIYEGCDACDGSVCRKGPRHTTVSRHTTVTRDTRVTRYLSKVIRNRT